ncbi:MAG: 1-acyl-sn-glycerol-3-phosphate acyltransferase, partial [Flavobacteriales bacterium]|nr:1-acyl-sn-glycerol-3-phosphate acyltransferase [Flavobacteriales bacterium]
LDRFIIVVAPHTSNRDFVVGLAVRSIARLTDVKFLAKDSLFGPLTGWFFRGLGGFPVDRSKHNNMVDAVVDLFGRGADQEDAITPRARAATSRIGRPASTASPPAPACPSSWPPSITPTSSRSSPPPSRSPTTPRPTSSA